MEKGAGGILEGYLLTMLCDCVVFYVTRNKEREAKVLELEGGGTPQEQAQELALEANPIFVKTSNVGDTIILILALCFHSIFEGIAIGVSGSKGEAWRNLWTISLHKIFAAIGLGIALLRMLPKRPFLTTATYSYAFALSIPIGVGIGIARRHDGGTRGGLDLRNLHGCLCNLRTCCHLISKGFKPSTRTPFHSPWFKFLAVLSGVAVIAVVLIWD